MKIIYRIDVDGNEQLQNDETGTDTTIKHASKRLGYVVTEFEMEIEAEIVSIVAFTPDTIVASERLKIERFDSGEV